MIRKLLLTIGILMLVIQLFRPEKNVSTIAPSSAIDAHYPIPKKIGVLLRRSCYDCHSNNTIYPWYSNIQPLAWWLRSHISEGKKELNFDDFGNYDVKKKRHKLDEVIEMIEKDEMPLTSYKIVHTKSVLSSQEKAEIIAWAIGVKEIINQ